MNPMKLFGVGAIHLYRALFFWLPSSCRFEPSCSRYTHECLRLHGAAKGSYLGFRRIIRCHPFHPGGYDPPPPLPDP